MNYARCNFRTLVVVVVCRLVLATAMMKYKNPDGPWKADIDKLLKILQNKEQLAAWRWPLPVTIEEVDAKEGSIWLQAPDDNDEVKHYICCCKCLSEGVWNGKAAKEFIPNANDGQRLAIETHIGSKHYARSTNSAASTNTGSTAQPPQQQSPQQPTSLPQTSARELKVKGAVRTWLGTINAESLDFIYIQEEITEQLKKKLKAGD